MHTAQNFLQPVLYAAPWLTPETCGSSVYFERTLAVSPSCGHGLCAVVLIALLVLMATLGESQNAHCALCIIMHVHGILSPSQASDRMSSTSWYWASAPQTFPKLSQVILCLERPGP